MSGPASLAARTWLALAVAACVPAPSQPAQSPTLRPATDAPFSPAPVPSATASSTPATSSVALPNPGGTCDAAAFARGEPVTFPGYASAGYALLFVGQSLRNGGPDCVLKLPAAIGVASGAGPFQAVPVQITRDPSSITIEHGETVSIVLGDSWWLGLFTETGETARPAPPCEGRIRDVDRVEFPLASGMIEIGLDQPWREVCSEPPSITVTVDDEGDRQLPTPPPAT